MAASVPVAAAGGTAAAVAAQNGSALRRGLPRLAGGDPWPPAGTVVVESAAEPAPSEASEPAAVAPAVMDEAAAPAAPSTAVATRPDVSAPLPFTRTVWNGSAPRRLAAEPASRPRPTWPQAIGGLFAAAGLAVLAGAAIAIVRALCSLPFLQDFLTTYPGEYHLPAGAPVGIPGWIGWQHFFNVFLMTLIIRSGLRVRSEKRPTAFWTPRGNPKGKISLTLWFHQGLDLLWIINGVIFVVLLFVTGQWMRIVPTSWDVFPNALSAALQYVSFDWPTENGWVNYNSLQQLAYFTIVFLAAPVAIATGFRMSGLWPKKAEGLSKAYPIEIARAVHFPTMLFFTAFIVVHVALVLLTGMLRNLNHMFAAQDAVTWTGFWVFVLSLVVIAGGWAAARPLVLAPIAKVFGQVSGR
ncbi:cytochrome b/b6 domain-containing protein [Microbacterium sp. 2MCAF23]|uniref:cytochrome b/b6 domain-containing protein n=1 Tax=Microbacterium sp. 2MCAF23 TaxID=3232985 RepID=UPI003F95A65F